MALVCAPRSGAGASKFSFSKNSRGLKYQYFFVKIGLKLIFTIKNRRKHTNLKLSLKTILFWPPKSMILVFEETPPPKKKKKIGKSDFERWNKLFHHLFIYFYLFFSFPFFPALYNVVQSPRLFCHVPVESDSPTNQQTQEMIINSK